MELLKQITVVVILLTMIPLITSIGITSNFSFAEETRSTCMSKVHNDKSLNFVEKRLGRQDCAKIWKTEPVLVNPEKIFGLSAKIIQFCEERYPVYLLVSEQQFYSVAHHPFSRTCLLLYNEPIWNYTEPDRPKVLLDFVRDKIEQHLEETKDERQNSIRDARIKHGRVIYLQDLFIQMIERTSYLEKQIQENDEQIAKNESIIQEQNNVIDELNRKIKNIVLTSSHSQIGNFTIEEITECIKIANSKPLSFVDKIKDVQQCAPINRIIPIEINDQKITKISQKAIEFCNDSYPLFLELSYSDYLNTVKHPLTRECAWLYQQPIWTYEGPDRAEKMFDFVKEHVKLKLEESSDERIKSVADAHIRQGRLPALVDFFNFHDQRIESLENQLDEQEELIAKQEAIIGEQIKEIQELAEQMKHTIFSFSKSL